MVRSMTGFGRGEARLGRGALTAEVKCVNARHLDVRVRMPRELAELEPQVRAVAAPFFARGQVEVSVRLPLDAQIEPEIEIDVDAAGRFVEVARNLAERFQLETPISVSKLLDLPGVVRPCEREADAKADLAVLEDAVTQACRQAAEMRAAEGATLEREVLGRLSGLEQLVTEIEENAEELGRGLRGRLEKRIAALAPELDMDPSRLDQEIVLYADRMDVTEETVRLRSHLTQFRETLSEKGPVGRKLEFLLQEMGREVNTIGSKAQDASISRRVVELKTEIEKIREQVLNIE